MEQPNDYALVIGIENYPNWPKHSLKAPIKDAEEFATWLCDKNTGGGLPDDNCRLLRNNNDDEIDVELGFIVKKINSVKKTKGQKPRRFYFYFSGHGQTDNVEDVNLCLNAWSSTMYSRKALSHKGLVNSLFSCKAFPECVVLLDCCRVQAVGAAGFPPGLWCEDRDVPAGPLLRFEACSSEYLKPSYEATNGYFTSALLAALKGGAASEAGGVSPESLKKYLEVEVTRLALVDQRHQVTSPISNLKESSLFGSALPIGQSHIAVHFLPGRVGPITLVFPDGSEAVCNDVSRDWILLLESGTYQLIDRGSNPPKEHPFHFKAKPEAEVTHVDF